MRASQHMRHFHSGCRRRIQKPEVRSRPLNPEARVAQYMAFYVCAPAELVRLSTGVHGMGGVTDMKSPPRRIGATRESYEMEAKWK